MEEDPNAPPYAGSGSWEVPGYGTVSWGTHEDELARAQAERDAAAAEMRKRVLIAGTIFTAIAAASAAGGAAIAKKRPGLGAALGAAGAGAAWTAFSFIGLRG